jgi:hypothetical protein
MYENMNVRTTQTLQIYCAIVRVNKRKGMSLTRHVARIRQKQMYVIFWFGT